MKNSLLKYKLPLFPLNVVVCPKGLMNLRIFEARYLDMTKACLRENTSFGIIATPGGIGAYTYLVAQILGAYNIADIPAQAFGWIAWAMQTVLIIVLGILSLLLIHPYNKKRNVQIQVKK